MMVRFSENKGDSVQAVIAVLNKNPELMEIVKAKNLPADFLETIATELFYNNHDVDTSEVEKLYIG